MNRMKKGPLVIPCIPDTFQVSTKRKSEEITDPQPLQHQPPTKKRKLEKITMDEDEDEDEEEEVEYGEEFQSYGKVAVEDFGLAMLMGMGYKSGQSFGRSKDPVKPLEPVRLPKLSGLGSVPLSKEDTEQQKKEEKKKKNQTSWEEYLLSSSYPQRITVNSMISVLRGPYDGLVGRVLSTNRGKRKNMSLIRLNLPNKLESEIKTEYLKLMQVKRLPAMHPARLFARSEFIIKDTQPNQPNQNHPLQVQPPPSLSNPNLHQRQQQQQIQPNHDMNKPNKPKKKKKKKKKRKNRWVTENVHVRIISKTYCQGKYYKQKGVVIDIPDEYTCSIQLDKDRTIINGLRESMIETIIPKKKNSKVLFVLGKYRGKTGKLIDKDNKKYIAFVQLEESLEIVKSSFDDICEKSVGSVSFM